MRLTLDRDAMQVLLDSMSEEARLDFSNRVVKQVLEKLITDLTIEQFKRALGEHKSEALNEYITKRGLFKYELTDREKANMKKAFEVEAKELRQSFLQELRESENKLRDSAQERILDRVEATAAKYCDRVLEERVTKALQDQLGSLMELGQAMREMKTVTPEPPNEQE